MPRVPEDWAAYEAALQPKGTPDTLYLVARRWQLTNTRYLLGPAGFLDGLNSQLDPVQRRFRIVTQFDIIPKPDIPRPMRLEDLTAEPSTNGLYALFEFPGVLPRAGLYSNWQVYTNSQATLQQLASASFDPSQTVLVTAALPTAPAPGRTNAPAGTVEFARYRPNHITLKAHAESPSVLLLNDKYDPDWQVYVDGRRAELLRCNFIMRGVFMPPGNHTVQFRFRPSIWMMYITISAMVLGLLMLSFLLLARRQEEPLPSPAQRAP